MHNLKKGHILMLWVFSDGQKIFSTNQTIINPTCTSWLVVFFHKHFPSSSIRLVSGPRWRPGRLLGHFAMFGCLFLTSLKKKEVEQNAASRCRADAVWLCGCQEICVEYMSSICKDVWSRASGIHVVPWGCRSCEPANTMLEYNYECIISSLLNSPF